MKPKTSQVKTTKAKDNSEFNQIQPKKNKSGELEKNKTRKSGGGRQEYTSDEDRH